MDLLPQLFSDKTISSHGRQFLNNNHVLGPKCWACSKPFTNSLLREDHHIIPSAFGGHDGPQVSLCSDHHSLLHKVADLLLAKSANLDVIRGFLLGLTEGEVSRILYLSTRAAQAERVFKNDPNRGVQLSVTVSNTLLTEVKKAATALNLTVTDLMQEAIKEYVRRRFPL